MNAATYFVDANLEAGRGGKAAIFDAGDGTIHTYQDVWSMVNRTGNSLRGLGLRPEERVMLLMLDSPELAFSFFGVIKIGAVAVPVNTLLKPEDYEYLLDDSRARVLIVSEALRGQIEPIRRRPYLEHVVVVGKSSDVQGGPVDCPGTLDYRELVEAASPELAPVLLSKDDACFWLYSSGTTGFPKGAVHLQHDMLVAADLYARPTLGISEGDRTFSVAKLFFAYGLGNGLYFPFRVGAATILYPGKPHAERAFEIIEHYRPTLFFGVPTSYASMLALKDRPAQEEGSPARPFDTGSLRLCISAGESLPPAIFERWKERYGVEILDGIGSTEILHIFISNRPGRARPGSTGELVPGYEARIVNEEGRDVPPGEVGDLLIKGDSVCACYWNQHEATKSTIQGCWIRTGDKYTRGQDGYFWYQGRSDDMLKVGGMWVSPVEVENALIQHPAVLECAVVGVGDAHGLVKPKAFVVLKDPLLADDGAGSSTGTSAVRPTRADLAAELQSFVKGRLAVYKYPRWIEFVSDLPKTATGKIQRYKLC
jgi:benzoate-CoA ligase